MSPWLRVQIIISYIVYTVQLETGSGSVQKSEEIPSELDRTVKDNRSEYVSHVCLSVGLSVHV